MKRKNLLVLFVFLGLAFSCQAQTWDEWFRQRKTQRKYLIQQIAKLQVYLEYLKKGYNIVHAGMNLISDIKRGDLTLHTIFFDHLKQVSPTVKRYAKVADILRMYTEMAKRYQSSTRSFRQSGKLSANEIDYLYEVLSNILGAATDDIEMLTDILTDYRYEMSDDERIRRIDILHGSVTEKYSSLFSFTEKINLLVRQRQLELKELQTLQNMYQP